MPVVLNFSSTNLPDISGVFDTLLLVSTNTGYKGFALEQHFTRFINATKKKNLPSLTFDELIQSIQTLVNSPQLPKKKGSLHLRLQSTGNGVELVCKPFTRRLADAGVILASIQSTRGDVSTKYLPATESIESITFAMKHGAAEALLINENGNITETSWSNFFWIEPGENICTAGKVLPGIVRKNLLEHSKWDVHLKSISLDTLLKNNFPCFITNSLHGITEVTQIDSVHIAQSPTTKEVIQWWNNRFDDFSHLAFFRSHQ